jgi:hypothetical protein
MNERNIVNGPQDEPDHAAPPALELVPSLAEVVRAAGLNPKKLAVAFEADGQKHVRVVDKHTVPVSDGQKIVPWAVPALSELFRGNRTPPADMDHYPPEYTPYFFFIENQVLTICEAMGDRADQEMEEVYSALRRRPDGRSVGVLHDLLWQVMALLLGKHPLSEAEFEALLGALVRSTRKWGLRPISRNYATFLRKTFSEVHSSSRQPR